jgi:hypothetical protein
MLSFEAALKLARAWLTIVVGSEVIIDTHSIRTLPYGWIFPWNSKAYLSDPERPFDKSLIGNVPLFIDRVNAELLVAGPAGINWIKAYEATIPTARLSLSPEYPVIDNHGEITVPEVSCNSVGSVSKEITGA